MCEERAQDRSEEVERARDRGTRSRRRVETKPFLLLSIRADQAAADDERESFQRFTGLGPDELRVVNLVEDPVPDVDLAQWSGVLLGGGPWNASDAQETKSPEQVRAETGIARLLDQVVARDFPFLGACYGIGTLGLHQGGVVDRSFPEAVGPLSVRLTAAGESDPVLAGVPTAFTAYGGHKEALTRLPSSAVSLATSNDCPVQAFRVGRHVYATQFHPELDLHGLCTRVDVYKHAGYFDPTEAEALKDLARAVTVEHPMRILTNFVALYRR